MSKNHSIRVAINRSVRGKYHGDDWAWYNRQFKAETTTARGLAVDIYKGFAFTPVYRDDWRKKENFQEAWHIAFDFDDWEHGSDLATITSDQFYSDHGAFCYSTPSSTPDHPKSRMVYIFESPITDPAIYEDLYRCLLSTRYSVHPKADQSTKDAARLFFGSEKCELSPRWQLLGMETITGMVSMWREIQAEIEADRKRKNPSLTVKPENASAVLKATMETMHKNITSAQDGQKHDTLRRYSYVLGGYVEGGYITEHDALNFLYNAINGMSNVESIEAAQKTAEDCMLAGRAKPITIEQQLAPPISAVL